MVAKNRRICTKLKNTLAWLQAVLIWSSVRLKIKWRHVAVGDFSRGRSTIIRGYEERGWMEFDTNFIKLPKPSEYVVYDCFGRVFVSSSYMPPFPQITIYFLHAYILSVYNIINLNRIRRFPYENNRYHRRSGVALLLADV